MHADKTLMGPARARHFNLKVTFSDQHNFFCCERYSYNLSQKKHYVYNVGVHKMVCYLDALLLRNASLKNAFHEKMLKTIYHVTKHFFLR